MSDENERSVASDGSVEPVAWAVVFDSTEQIDCEFVYPDEATAGDVALDSNGGVVPLYRQPQNGVVRLPPLDPNGAPGWNAAIGAVREALAEAGVDWDTE